MILRPAFLVDKLKAVSIGKNANAGSLLFSSAPPHCVLQPSWTLHDDAPRYPTSLSNKFIQVF